MKRDYPVWAILMFILALALPTVPVHSGTITVPLCGGSGGVRVIRLAPNPANPGKQDNQECCDKACHAGNDRRKRAERPTHFCC